MRILIVEDEKHTSLMYQSFLEQKGECDIVEKGQDAINVFNRSIVQNEPYDIILLDINLPDIDGLNVLEIIREKEKRADLKTDKMIPVIMVTGIANKDFILRAVKLNCAGYIIKPVDKKILVEKIDSVMEKRKQ